MARHTMIPSDLRLVRWAQDAQLSPDASRVAWCEVALDVEKDEPVTNIMVASTVGAGEPRRFTDGPRDVFPRWSPDSRYLAYLSAAGGPPALHLAPLDGGTPLEITTPGGVRWIEWAPEGDRLVLVLNVLERGSLATEPDPREQNAARVIRGMVNRLDGQGWLTGRNHLFVYDVATNGLRPLTSGDYDEEFPSWSPDGTSIVFISDRSRRRNDRTLSGDVWTMSAEGGRPRRLAADLGQAAFPTFSPDGSRVAFTGTIGAERQAGRDCRLLVVETDRRGTPQQIAPEMDRPVALGVPGKPFAWLSDDELIFTVADAGTVALRRARLDSRKAREVLAGDARVEGIALAGAGRRRLLAFTSSWVDSPAEVVCLDLAGRARTPVQVSRTSAELLESVELLPTERLSARAPDGLEIEYFVVRPRAGQARPGRRTPKPPLYLEIHGGPHGHNPSVKGFTLSQVLAAAGYLVVMPNPRGSIGYGESFTSHVRGDWGGADFGDLMACVDDAIDRGLADPARQFVGGYSYGGFMSASVVGRTTRFAAACVGAPITDHVSEFGTWDGAGYFADMMAADPWSSGEELWSRSPLKDAPKVRTPVLLYVHDGDLRCPPSQADEFYTALKWHKREVEYVRYPGGSHVSALPMASPPSQSEDFHHRILDFLGRHGGIPARQPKKS